MNENDTILIQELVSSYGKQLEYYKELRTLVQKLIGKLVLSRGDMGGLINGLKKKQVLLNEIENERNLSLHYVQKYKERKKDISGERTEILNEVLLKIENAIKEFLNEEDQLKKYIESFLQN